MKKLILSTIIISFLMACGGTVEKGELNELKQKRTKLKDKITGLESELKKLDEEIALLDTTNKIKYPLVTVASSVQKSFAEKVTFQGTIEADKNIMVSPETGGIINNIYVKEGEKVNAGDVLASLDSDILSKNMEEIKKALELAEYMLEKQTKLREQGVGTEVEYTRAKNQKESLEKNLETLKAQAGKSKIISPITGYVDEIFPNIGEMGSPQMPMFRVLNLDKVTVVSEISENYLPTIKAGSQVSVYFPSINYRLENLKVTRAGKFINSNNRTFSIQIDIPNKDGKILPNLLAEVEVTKRFADSAILVPSASIFEDNKEQKYVYVLEEDNQVQKRIIQVDFVQGDTTKIKTGIKQGEVIVVAGATAIVDGEKVEIKK